MNCDSITSNISTVLYLFIILKLLKFIVNFKVQILLQIVNKLNPFKIATKHKLIFNLEET